MIRSQKEVIADLEAKIHANTEEIGKVYISAESGILLHAGLLLHVPKARRPDGI